MMSTMRKNGRNGGMILWAIVLIVPLLSIACTTTSSIGPLSRASRSARVDTPLAGDTTTELDNPEPQPWQIGPPEPRGTNLEKGADGVLRVRKITQMPQFNTGEYVKSTPSREMLEKLMTEFRFIDDAHFVMEDSSVVTGDRFETYDVLMRLPSHHDFRQTVSLCQERLESGFIRNDWITEIGQTTCFRKMDKTSSTVISIISLNDKGFIDIKIRYHFLKD